MSRPRRTPPSTQTSVRPPTAATTSASASTAGRTRSSWRAPWLLTTIASAPCSTARRASSAVRMPFRTSGRRRPAPDLARSAQVEGRRVLQLGLARRHGARASAPTSRKLPSGGQLEPGSPIAVARAEHREVDRQDDRAVAGGRGALDEPPRASRVGLDVELEPADASGAAAATSSIERDDIVDRMNGTPAAAAPGPSPAPRRDGRGPGPPSARSRPGRRPGARAGSSTGRPTRRRPGPAAGTAAGARRPRSRRAMISSQEPPAT